MQLLSALAVGLALALPLSVAGANHQITGGSYGALCSSGGYFTPSSLTVASGDTVTISVPANDPYPGGVQVHGFPEGNFTILPGSSHTTAPLTANVSYNGTWPSSSCPKGSGTITVTLASTPTPTPTPALSPTPVGQTPPGGSTASTSPTPPGATPSASPKATARPASGLAPEASPTPSPTARPVATSSKPGSGSALVLGSALGSTMLVVVLGLLGFRLWLQQRVVAPSGEVVSVTLHNQPNSVIRPKEPEQSKDGQQAAG